MVTEIIFKKTAGKFPNYDAKEVQKLREDGQVQKIRKARGLV